MIRNSPNLKSDILFHRVYYFVFFFLFSGMLGDVKLEDLPGPEALLRPGNHAEKGGFSVPSMTYMYM